jgi:peptidoglycan hydrolase CwlO-like protein
MAILKKIKSSTLMETLVATVLIVVIFMISSMILNNVFANSINNDKRAIDTRLHELMYLASHDKLQLPYYGNFKLWDIDLTLDKINQRYQIKAIHQTNKQEIERHMYGD